MKRIIIFGLVLLLVVGLVSGAAPSVNLARVNTTISEGVAYVNDTLLGYCNASDGDGNTLQFPSRWYVNGVLNATDYIYPEGKFIDELVLDGNNSNGRDIAMNDSYLFVVDYTDDMIYWYDFDGNWVGNCSIPFVDPTGITLNASSFFVSDPNNDRVYGLDLAICNWTGFNFSVTDPRELAMNGTHFFVLDGGITKVVEKYTLAGVYVDTLNPTGETLNAGGVDVFGTFSWVVDGSNVIKYYSNSNYTGFYWAHDDSDALVINDSYVWVLNNSGDSVQRYYLALPEGEVVLVDNNVSGSLEVGQNWSFGCMATDLSSNSSWLNSSVLTIGLPVYDFVNPVGYFNQSSYEGLNVTNHSWVRDVGASLYYNGSLVGSSESSGGDYFFFNGSIVPQSSGVVGFVWVVNVTYIDNSSYLFYLFGNQSVLEWGIDNCSVWNQTTINMTIFSEEYPSLFLNATVEVEFNYWVNNPYNFSTYNAEGDGSHTYTFCLMNGDDTIYADAYIKYTAVGGFTHRYYLVNQTLTNTTLNLSLYNFNRTAGVSDLKITARNNNDYSFYENIIGRLQRRYPSEGVWRTVQMDESDDFGQIFFNVVEESVDYRMIFTNRYNEVLRTTEQMTFICSGGVCELVVFINPSGGVGVSTAFVYNWSYNNDTGVIDVWWNDPLGLTSDMRMLVTRETMTGSQIICNTSVSGASGNISCNASAYTGTAFLMIFSSASPESAMGGHWIALTSLGLKLVIVESGEGALWAFAIVLTIAMFGLFSPAGSVITTIIGLVVVYFLGVLTPITLTFIVIACVLGIAIGLKLKR